MKRRVVARITMHSLINRIGTPILFKRRCASLFFVRQWAPVCRNEVQEVSPRRHFRNDETQYKVYGNNSIVSKDVIYTFHF